MGSDIFAITVPKWGLTMEEGTVAEWTAEVGDAIAPGDEVVSVETDKIANEVEIQIGGILRRKVAEVGEVLPVGALLGVVAENGVDDAAIDAFIESFQSNRKAKAVPAPAKPVQASTARRAESSDSVSPRALKLAEEKGIDIALVPGTGRGGRVMRGDVLAYLRQGGPAAATGTPQRDVAEDAAPEPMSSMRKIVAKRLTESYTTTPHFFTTVSVDMTDLLALRQEWKAQGAQYSVTDFITKAVVAALGESPDVNASTDGQSILRHKSVHLGLAVALDEGLIVPVIRNADQLSLADLHERAAGLVDKAHAKRLTLDDIGGGTFTISNMGMLDVENFTAIINPGEGAILAVSSVIETPIVRCRGVAIRSVMKMTLSSDHRLIDGATAARFINAIKTKLEDTGQWELPA